MKLSKILSVVLFIAVLLSSFSCTKPNKNSDGSSDGADKNTLKEDVKYYFDSADVSVSFKAYYEYEDSMSLERYDALCKQIEEECRNDLQQEINERTFYTKNEDGSYSKHTNEYYIFSDGNVYSIFLQYVGEGDFNESIGEYEGCEVYYDFTDPWETLGGAEGFINATKGTYTENNITLVLKDMRARISGGKLVVEERYKGDYYIDYTCSYIYYYVPQE